MTQVLGRLEVDTCLTQMLPAALSPQSPQSLRVWKLKGIPGTCTSRSDGKHRIKLKDMGFRLKAEIKSDQQCCFISVWPLIQELF